MVSADAPASVPGWARQVISVLFKRLDAIERDLKAGSRTPVVRICLHDLLSEPAFSWNVHAAPFFPSVVADAGAQQPVVEPASAAPQAGSWHQPAATPPLQLLTQSPQPPPQPPTQPPQQPPRQPPQQPPQQASTQPAQQLLRQPTRQPPLEQPPQQQWPQARTPQQGPQQPPQQLLLPPLLLCPQQPPQQLPQPAPLPQPPQQPPPQQQPRQQPVQQPPPPPWREVPGATQLQGEWDGGVDRLVRARGASSDPDGPVPEETVTDSDFPDVVPRPPPQPPTQPPQQLPQQPPRRPPQQPPTQPPRQLPHQPTQQPPVEQPPEQCPQVRKPQQAPQQPPLQQQPLQVQQWPRQPPQQVPVPAPPPQQQPPLQTPQQQPVQQPSPPPWQPSLPPQPTPQPVQPWVPSREDWFEEFGLPRGDHDDVSYHSDDGSSVNDGWLLRGEGGWSTACEENLDCLVGGILDWAQRDFAVEAAGLINENARAREELIFLLRALGERTSEWHDANVPPGQSIDGYGVEEVLWYLRTRLDLRVLYPSLPDPPVDMLPCMTMAVARTMDTRSAAMLLHSFMEARSASSPPTS